LQTEAISDQETARRQKIASIRTIVGIGVVALLAQLGWMALNFSALPMWVEKQLDQGQHLGFFLGAFMFTEAVFRPSLGALSDRIGRRPLMLAGPFISMFTSVATIYVANPYLMICLRVLDGVGMAAFWPSSFAAIGDAVEEKYRSTAMAVLNGTGMAGMALGMLLGGMANDLTKSWLRPLTGAFYFASLIFLLTVVAGLVLFPRKALHSHTHYETDENAPHVPHKDEMKGAIHLVPDMLILSVVVFVAIGLLMPVVKLYAYDQLRMSETQFGALVAPLAAILGVCAVPFGHLADRWGKMSSVCYGLVMCTTSMWLIAIFKSMWVMIGASAVLGVGFVLAFPSWMAVISVAAPPNRRGQIMGAVGMMQGVGAMIGVLIAPIIYSSDWLSVPRLGVVHYNIPFYLCAVMLSIGTVLTFTWISGLRGKQCGGRQVTLFERRAVTAAALIGVICICGWVTFRYTRPVPPDRVAWQWVRQLVHERPKKAEKFTLHSFEVVDGNGKTTSEFIADYYHRWVSKDKMRYTLTTLSISPDGNKAVVQLVFRPLKGDDVEEKIFLDRQASGEWKVSGKTGRNDGVNQP
jgi:MFS transporter, DHA1 family, multidrug resistance protein